LDRATRGAIDPDVSFASAFLKRFSSLSCSAAEL
jgi:hypothetical protein